MAGSSSKVSSSKAWAVSSKAWVVSSSKAGAVNSKAVRLHLRLHLFTSKQYPLCFCQKRACCNKGTSSG